LTYKRFLFMNSDKIAEKFNLSKTDAEQFIKLFSEDELKDSRLFVISNTYDDEIEFLEYLHSEMTYRPVWDEHSYPVQGDWDDLLFNEEVEYTESEMLDKYSFDGIIEDFYKSYCKYLNSNNKIYIAMHNKNFTNNK